MRLAFAGSVVAALLLSACAEVSAGAEDAVAIDPAVLRGKDFVARNCAGCHAPNPTGASVLRAAPPFRDLHQAPDMLRAAVLDISGTPHDRMPSIIITPGEASEVVAYIRALSDPDPAVRRRMYIAPCIADANPCWR